MTNVPNFGSNGQTVLESVSGMSIKLLGEFGVFSPQLPVHKDGIPGVNYIFYVSPVEWRQFYVLSITTI